MHRSAAAQEEDNVEMDHCLKVWIGLMHGMMQMHDGMMWHVIVLSCEITGIAFCA